MIHRTSTLSKLWPILSAQQRRSTVVLFGMMLVGTGLETIGVGLVMPAVMLMVPTASVGDKSEWLGTLQVFDNMTREQLILAAMGALVGIYALKVAYLSAFAWVQARFVQSLQARVSAKLFAGYLKQPYAFHLQRNSAELIQNTIGHSHTVASTVHQGLNAAAELLVLVAVSAMLVVVQPIGTLIVGVTLGCAVWALNAITRHHVTAWGIAAQWHDRMRLQHLQQGLGGVKEVKVLGREFEFVGRFERHTDAYARINVNHGTLQQLPRLWLELLAVAGLAALAVAVVQQGKSVEMILPTVGLFSAAAFRLLPSTNRLLAIVPVVRFSASSIDTVFRELQMFDVTPDVPQNGVIPFCEALTLTNVSYRYADTAAMALDNITLTVDRGASVGFVGGSGAGKTTLIDIILGLHTPASGVIAVDGVDVRTNIRAWQAQIGYVPQSIFLTDESLRRNVAFGVPERDISEEAVLRAIRAAQLEEFVQSLPDGLDTVVGERGVRLSGGQRQRIGIARALYHDPAVLVLDEATSALDTATEEGVMQSVAALDENKTVLIVAHRWSTVARCDRIYRLERGKIIEASVPAEFTAPIK